MYISYLASACRSAAWSPAAGPSGAALHNHKPPSPPGWRSAPRTDSSPPPEDAKSSWRRLCTVPAPAAGGAAELPSPSAPRIVRKTHGVIDTSCPKILKNREPSQEEEERVACAEGGRFSGGIRVSMKCGRHRRGCFLLVKVYLKSGDGAALSPVASHHKSHFPPFQAAKIRSR